MSEREDLSEILSNIDMESYLDREAIEYRLTRGSSGEQLQIKECPECGGNEWKVYLNADTGLGNCFAGSCGTTFNKWSFIRSHLQGSSTGDVFRHIKTVSQEHGWRPKKVAREVDEEASELKLPESVPLPYKGKNLSYLTARGISLDMAKHFNLRFSSKGMFWYKHEGEVRFQSYKNRILIPIYDIEGVLVSFQGRDITGDAEKKYLFPPGFASTGKYLYNAHNATGAKSIVVNEGVFDVMATRIALDQDVSTRSVVSIGTFGKHLSSGGSNDQIAQFILLKQSGLKEATFMWDGERLATEAAVKSALEISKLGITVRIAILPDGKDPNEVPAHVVRDAYKNATTVNKRTAVRLLLGK